MTEAWTEEQIRARIHPIRSPLVTELVERIHADTVQATLASRALTQLQVEVESWSARKREQDTLVQNVLAEDSPPDRHAWIREYLALRAQERVDPKKDRKAVGRLLDLAAVLDWEAVWLARSVQRIQSCLDILKSEPALLDPALFQVLDKILATELPVYAKEHALLVLFERLQTNRDAEEEEVPESLVKKVRAASAPDGDPFVQVAALVCESALEPNTFDRIRERLRDPVLDQPDDFLVRRNLVRTLGELGAKRGELDLRNDPSEHVRQEWCRFLATKSDWYQLVEVIGGDDTPEVRSVAVQEVIRGCGSRVDEPNVAAIAESLVSELDRTSSRLLANVILDGLGELLRARQALAPTLVPRLASYAEQTADAALAFRAAALLGELEVHSSAVISQHALEKSLWAIPEGAEGTLMHPKRGAFLKALALSAQNGLLIAARPTGDSPANTYRVRRGERRVPRLWRLLHEVRSPGPDKRQDANHTVGRMAPGRWVFPPKGLGEVTPTKVPGERRWHSESDGWVPFLPRVDDFLECARGGARPRQIITPLGEATITPPDSRARRQRLALTLSLRYAALSEMRDASIQTERPKERKRYIQAMEELGFRIEWTPASGSVGETPYSIKRPHTKRYFPSALLPVLLVGPLTYLLSDQGNLPAHLLIVLLVVLAVLALRSLLTKRSVTALSDRIPFVIGGWGTRGKSGTERLKAGLFQGLGLDVWVKTTGCEAMLIHAIPSRTAHEVFLYRPYDKATIWEQVRTLEIAEAAGAQVFLWECMALSPALVEILAHQWVRAPLATLTNAYPDHEDIQGPTGEDVARVISSFMPKSGICFTSEVEMLPILTEQARKSDTDLRVLSPTEALLLPRDLLERFPYQEHPRNIALVSRMAEHLGVDGERAIVHMADHVVPDLGVLKTYPEVQFEHRTLFFSNGMSANERAGCLNNWTRLGLFDTPKEGEEVVTVVNNRADRIPRSRVFAKILVEDISASAHVFIGTNLVGIKRFVTEALDDWLSSVEVFQDGESPVDPDARTRALSRFSELMVRTRAGAQSTSELMNALTRIVVAVLPPRSATPPLSLSEPVTIESVLARVEPLLSEVDVSAKRDAVVWCKELTVRFLALMQVQNEIRNARDGKAVNQRVRALYRERFLSNLHMVEDSHATGDQVLSAAARRRPPGTRIHLVGLQNIKGTGLDFVYRWLSVDQVTRQLKRLERTSERRSVLGFLETYEGFGLLDAELALRAVEDLERAQERKSKQVERVKNRLLLLVHEKRARLSTTARRGGKERLSDWLEAWLEPLDSMYRARAARHIQEELSSGRVGQARAAEKMRQITSRDKGGWLYKSLKARLGSG